MHDIPQYKNWTKIEPINKGWSSDKKYYIETKDSEKLLLRVSDISEYEIKKVEYEAIKKLDGFAKFRLRILVLTKRSIPLSTLPNIH